jgi:hypothetical protein
MQVIEISDDEPAESLAVKRTETKTRTPVLMNQVTFLGKRKRQSECWDGRVKMTNQLTIDDLLQRDILQKLLVSSFVLDQAFLFSKLPPVPLVVVMPRESPESYNFQSGKQTFIFPPMNNRGCMHIKLMILWFGAYVRIVVTSANLIEADWTVIDNVVYYQDFRKTSDAVDCPFKSELQQLLSAMGVPDSLVDQLDMFDFRPALGMLVASRPGTFNGGYGMDKLASIVSEMDLDTNDMRIVLQVYRLTRHLHLGSLMDGYPRWKGVAGAGRNHLVGYVSCTRHSRPSWTQTTGLQAVHHSFAIQSSTLHRKESSVTVLLAIEVYCFTQKCIDSSSLSCAQSRMTGCI